jgi:hypothetical protein
MSVYAGPRVVTDGLIGYWDAGNTKSYPGSGTSWFDLSGRAYEGTLVNSPTYSDGVFNFNGSNTHIITTLPYSGSTDYTMSCWFKTSVAQRSGICGFRTSGVAGGLNWNQFIFYISGDLNIGTNGDYIKYDEFSQLPPAGGSILTSRSVFIDTVPVTTNNWINVVATTNSSKSTIYYNAVEVANTTGTQPTRDLAAPFIVGVAPNYSPASPNAVLAGFAFNGSISNSVLYNRALSASEVQQNFNALRGRFGI